MLEFKYDTQLLIEGTDLDEDVITEYFTNNFKGDCLLAVGDEELIKIHYHTNEPWKVLEYCASLGEIYDIVIEDMDRQSRGLQGQKKMILKEVELTDEILAELIACSENWEQENSCHGYRKNTEEDIKGKIGRAHV